MKSIHTSHDLGYKWLLSSREIFMQLLRSFVKQPWVEKINETTIKRVEKSFIAKDFREKEADLVYEVNLEGQPVVFYILLELQRKVDFSMPYRLLNYMSGIWQNALQTLPASESLGQKSFRLPAIVPIVLYNGAHAWTAARSFRDLLSGADHFGAQLLNFEYIVLQVNQYEDAALLNLSNTIGAAFLLDKNSRRPQELRNLLKDLYVSLQNASDQELLIFLRWMRYILKPRLPAKQQDEIEQALRQHSDKEVRTMVFANLEKSLDMLEEESRQKGRQKGLQEGLETAALEMLRDKVSAQTVAKYTKLPLDRIHDLMKRIE